MDIVYKLINRSKDSGKRFYIGAKQECRIEKLGGVDTMVNVRNRKPYYSSSQSQEFKDDMMRGDVFEVEVLEHVIGANLWERESYYMSLFDVANSTEYYNMRNYLASAYYQDDVGNSFGETTREISSRNSSLSKRDGGAIKAGFRNFGEMYLDIAKRGQSGESFASISKSYGRQRHFSRVTFSAVDIAKCNDEIKRKDEYLNDLRDLISKGCTFYKACEILNLELPSGRIILDDFIKDRVHLVAQARGLTRKELGEVILQKVLDGLSLSKAAIELNLEKKATERYFLDAVRKRFRRSEPKRTK